MMSLLLDRCLHRFRFVKPRTVKLRTAGALASVLLLVAVVMTVQGCHKDEAAATAEHPPTPVVATAAISQDVPVYLDEIGKTVARESVTIHPQMDGKIMAVHFTDGANIKKGDLLFNIDARPFEAALNQAKATLAQANANLNFAKGEVDRMTAIINTGAISKQEIETKQNAVAVAEAQVQAGQAAVETAKVNLDYCTIVSPIDGRAGQRLVDPGNIVRQNETALLTIQNLDPIYADFTVTENEFGTVRRFMAEGKLPAVDPQGKLRALVSIPADERNVIHAVGSSTKPSAASTTQPVTQAVAPREGVITFLDNTVQDGTGTVKVRATVPNEDKYFWPGQFVNVRLVLTTKVGAVLVPNTAIQIGQQGPFVYVVKSDSTAEMRPVATGQRQGDLVVLTTGVNAGEQVVTKGQMLLSPGAKVMVANTAPAAPTTQAVAEGSH